MAQSKAQVRLARAVLAGTSDAFSKAVAQEIVDDARGKRLPEKVKKRKAKKRKRRA